MASGVMKLILAVLDVLFNSVQIASSAVLPLEI